MKRKIETSALKELFQGSKFAKSKQRKPAPVRIKFIDMDNNPYGHIWVKTHYLKAGPSDIFVPRVYTCAKCGLVGVLRSRWLRDNRLELVKAYIDVKCTEESGMIKTLHQKKGKVLILMPLLDFGIERGQECEVVSCPPDQAHKYGDHVWVWSPTRNEPIRLMKGEFKYINQNIKR